MIILKPVLRRVVYVALFEIFAILLSTLLLTFLSKGEAQDSLPVAVAVSVIAVVWNYIFNTGFEFWERRCKRSGRSLLTRVTHAILFEIGLFLFTVPLYMVWYSVGMWQAFKMEVAILIFFLIYAFLFTWIFDSVFALPNRKRPLLGSQTAA